MWSDLDASNGESRYKERKRIGASAPWLVVSSGVPVLLRRMHGQNHHLSGFPGDILSEGEKMQNATLVMQFFRCLSAIRVLFLSQTQAQLGLTQGWDSLLRCMNNQNMRKPNGVATVVSLPLEYRPDPSAVVVKNLLLGSWCPEFVRTDVLIRSVIEFFGNPVLFAVLSRYQYMIVVRKKSSHNEQMKWRVLVGPMLSKSFIGRTWKSYGELRETCSTSFFRRII